MTDREKSNKDQLLDANKIGQQRPIFIEVKEGKCQYECRRHLSGQEQKKCLDECQIWEPFYQCMKNHRGTGIPQCTPNFY